MHISSAYVGMRFIVTDAGACGMSTYGDYENGDTGTVRRVVGRDTNLVYVNWDKPRYQDEHKEGARCDCLHAYEISPR